MVEQIKQGGNREIPKTNLEQAITKFESYLWSDSRASCNEVYRNIFKITEELKQSEMSEFWNEIRETLSRRFPIPYKDPNDIEREIELFSHHLERLTRTGK